MTSYFRRAGAQILRSVRSFVDPSAETDRINLFAKQFAGSTQMYGRTSSGILYPLAGNANWWDVPQTPHVDDDEFLSTTLNPAWSVASGVWSNGNINPYASFAAGDNRYELHTQRRRSWLMCQPPADSSGKSIEKAITVPGDFVCWVRASYNARLTTTPTNNDYLVQVNLSASPFDVNNQIALDLNETDASAYYLKFVKVVAGVQTVIGTSVDKFTTQADMQELEGFVVQRIGGNIYGWGIQTNGSMIFLGTSTFSAAIVISTVRLNVSNVVSSAPGNTIMGFDFIRFSNTPTFLP